MVLTSPEFPIRQTKNAGREREFPQHGNVTAEFACNIPRRLLQPKPNRGRQGWRPRFSWIMDDVVCAERSRRSCSWDDGISMSQPAVLVSIGLCGSGRTGGPGAFDGIGPGWADPGRFLTSIKRANDWRSNRHPLKEEGPGAFPFFTERLQRLLRNSGRKTARQFSWNCSRSRAGSGGCRRRCSSCPSWSSRRASRNRRACLR